MKSDLLTLFDPLPKVLNPPLKWAGGKRWLVPHLLKLYEPHRWRRLVEPFAGGLAVSLGLMPERALISDINPHLINFYLWLQKGLEIEIELLNDSIYFYGCRTRFNDLLKSDAVESKEAAELFYYLNRTCFNGLCRFNGSGGFNVPFGKYKSINYVSGFPEYSKVFAAWDFSCLPFEKVETLSDDFLYLDPPYDTPFVSYSKEGFDWSDQVRLAEWAANQPGPVLVSNQATERVLSLYASLGFEIETMPAPRRISCNGDRTPALEMLAAKGI